MYHEPVSIDAINGPAAFLDRDGVLNQAVVRHGRPYPPASVEEIETVNKFDVLEMKEAPKDGTKERVGTVGKELETEIETLPLGFGSV